MSDASNASDAPRRDDQDNARDEQDTDAILARRRRFVAAALGSLTLAASAACSPPQPCLEYVEPDRVGSDASDSSSPQPCLSAPLDVRSADAVSDVVGEDSVMPQPCLSPVLDSGVPVEDAADVDADDAAPAACLRMAPPGDADTQG